jgi:hypothetical protein
MDDVDDLFEALGGPAEVGRMISVTTEHAASMRRRGSIPSAYWLLLVTKAAERGIEGVTLEVLAKLAATAPRTSGLPALARCAPRPARARP